MKRIFVLAGDYYHPFAAIESSLLHVLELPEMGGKYELRFIEAEHLAEALGEKPDCIILYKEDRINPNDKEVRTWMTEPLAEAIVRYVDEGGSWLAWHSGLASYKRESVFAQMLCGSFEYHPQENRQVTYVAVNEGRETASSFAFIDEHYFVHCDEARTGVYLRSESVDGQSIAGWRHPFGAGRVSCFTPAHRLEGLLDSDVLRLLSWNIRWLCREIA